MKKSSRGRREKTRHDEDELTALLSEKYETVPQVTDMPHGAMLSAIAAWMHIDEPGFARADLRHMMEETNALIGMLQLTYTALSHLADAARDDEDVADEGDPA